MDKERLKEIIKIAYKFNWLVPNQKGYPLMELSEVEKCMVAMYDDFELNRMRKWYNEELEREKSEVEKNG